MPGGSNPAGHPIITFFQKFLKILKKLFFKKFLKRGQGAAPLIIPLKPPQKPFYQKFLKILKKLFSKSFLSGVKGQRPFVLSPLKAQAFSVCQQCRLSSRQCEHLRRGGLFPCSLRCRYRLRQLSRRHDPCSCPSGRSFRR